MGGRRRNGDPIIVGQLRTMTMSTDASDTIDNKALDEFAGEAGTDATDAVTEAAKETGTESDRLWKAMEDGTLTYREWEIIQQERKLNAWIAVRLSLKPEMLINAKAIYFGAEPEGFVPPTKEGAAS
jgi:hypothetical protein